MFTGIIQALGHVEQWLAQGDDVRLSIHSVGLDLSTVHLGDSIAVSGVCLTAVKIAEHAFWADVSAETLLRTNFNQLRPGSKVNLEKALTLSTPLGGHLVSGHVDGIGIVNKRWDDGRSVRLEIQAPAELAKYIAQKGSICIDGISLTVNEITGAVFGINIVPHTLEATTMQAFQPGREVNLEVDLVARYLERLMLGDAAAEIPTAKLDKAFLSKHGFIEQRKR